MRLLAITIFSLMSLLIDAIEIKLHTGLHKRQASDFTVEDVKDYLVKYNYLQEEKKNNNEDFADAVRVFKNFVGITPVNPNVTEEVITQMKRKRCGCPDIYTPMINLLNQPRSKRDVRTFRPQPFNARNRWRRTSLTWRIDRFTRKLPREGVRIELRRAFDVWAKVTPLRFTEIQSGTPDILISFFTGDHGDGAPFDRESGVLAHAFFPEDGTTHFDDAERWIINSSAGIDFFTVAAHEFGHALGLGHSEVRGALMAPFYSGYDPNFRLSTDDIAGIQSLYGPRTSPPRPTRPTRPRVTTTTTPAPTPPPPPRSKPPICRSTFIAAMEDDNGFLLLFKRNYFNLISEDNTWINPNVNRYTRSIFRWAPFNPDAVFNTINGTFFIRRQLVFKYSRISRNVRPMISVDYTLDLSEQIRAAVAVGENQVFLIGSQSVWMYNTRLFQIIGGSQRNIQDVFPGIPNEIDAAFTLDNNEIIFLKGTNFVAFNLRTRQVTPPREFGAEFLPDICG